MKSKLERSRSDRVIAGVCGGLGHYLGIDPIIIRIFFILLVLGQGAGVLIYIICWLAIPDEGRATHATLGETVHEGANEIAGRARELGGDMRHMASDPNPQVRVWLGVGLVLVGGLFLLNNLNLTWLAWFNLSLLWPGLLILGGVVLLIRSLNKGA
jgi:phage shock protein C